MGKKSRFLNLSYLGHTLVIKAKSLVLTLLRGSYPYVYFQKKPLQVIDSVYALSFSELYHSLAYLEFESAQKLHPPERSITQELIVGLVYYNALIKDSKLDHKFLIDIASNLKDKAEYSNNGMIFWCNEPYARFDLSGKYYSGIVQGKAASFFLRCYKLTEDNKYKSWAKNCLSSAWKSTDDGGVLRKLPKGHFWVEEYPSPQPSMVLNGYLFFIIGLAEYLSFEDDEILQSHFETCLNSVTAWLPNFKLNNGLLYSMYRWNLCNVHYTAVMKYQFEHLYKLTGISIFDEFAAFSDDLTNWETFGEII